MKSITVLDVAIYMGADHNSLTIGEFDRLGLPMVGGCQVCGATIAAYNASPSQSGYLKCANSCIGDSGFPTVKAYLTWEAYQQALNEAAVSEDNEGSDNEEPFGETNSAF